MSTEVATRPVDRGISLTGPLRKQTRKFALTASVTLLANAFNLFNTKTVLAYDQWTELTFGVPNPDFGSPETQLLAGHPPQFQAPFAMRLGARLRF